VKTLLQTLLLTSLMVTFATAAETRISVREEGRFLTIQGQLSVPVNPATAWTVLTDYARFPEFVPGIHGSRILQQRNTMKMIEQSGMVTAGSFRMPFQGLAQVEELRREGQPDSIRIAFVSGPMKDVVGEWRLTPGTPLELSYSLRMDIMKTPFPPPMAATIVEQQVRTWVEAVAREMQTVKRKKE
jgi:ribosome-associated toxin RatA of RatAB toxin-antitoxin module